MTAIPSPVATSTAMLFHTDTVAADDDAIPGGPHHRRRNLGKAGHNAVHALGQAGQRRSLPSGASIISAPNPGQHLALRRGGRPNIVRNQNLPAHPGSRNSPIQGIWGFIPQRALPQEPGKHRPAPVRSRAAQLVLNPQQPVVLKLLDMPAQSALCLLECVIHVDHYNTCILC